METMFLIPAMNSPMAPSVSKPKLSLKRNNTNETCSCGSDVNQHNQQAGKRRLQQGSSSSSNQDLSPSSVSSHIRTVSTATIINDTTPKPAFEVMESTVADELVEKTQQRVKHALAKASAPFRSVDAVPKFSFDVDVTRGDLLGSGGFANVYAVDIKEPSRLRFHKPNQQYVVKHLSPKLLVAPLTPAHKRKLHAGAKDIVLESHTLSALHHENIVTVHGLSRGGIHAFSAKQQTDAYFMILPRLECTLADKISAWKRERLQQQEETTNTTTGTITTKSSWWRRRSKPDGPKKQMLQAMQLEFLCERLEIVVQLCAALEYLHSKRIMHRDIKPPNIGFDRDGTLKLFDFGLAKELPTEAYSLEKKPKTTSTFSNLGNTGTTRYMAPEVIRRDPYNCKVDVFAISIVTWELMTLKKPYGAEVSGQFVKECVAIYDDRPTIPSGRSGGATKHSTVWPKSLKRLVQQGWTKDIGARLTAGQMKQGLRDILAKKQQQHLQARVLMGDLTTGSSSLKNSKESGDPIARFSLTASTSC